MRAIASVMTRLRASILPILFLFVLAAALGGRAFGQSVSSLYMAGGSYNPGASPAFAGSALYAHQVSPDTAPGMYAFTMLDVLPAGSGTVTTNVGVGIAQKIATIDGFPIFIPTAAGISFTGANTGWAWSTGAAVPFQFKAAKSGGWYLMPNLRVLKSSVSGGTGYQPIFGVMVGWGK